MKKIFLVVLFLLGLSLFATNKLYAAPQKLELLFFYSETCPHCHKEEIFLDKLGKKYPELDIKRYEVTTSQKNSQLMLETGKKLGINVQGVPFTVIGDQYFIGYRSDETTGKEMERVIVEKLGEVGKINNDFKVPLLGNINPKEVSLPLLSVVIGVADGFNPCAMWALIFLISLLLGMKDKKRMWVLGSTFILISGLIYFLFMAAWLNFFLFVGFIWWIRIIIGIVAIGAGVYNLYDYWTNKDASCKVSKGKKRSKFFESLKKTTQKRSLLLALIGISILAISVNMVELICSAGFPAIYTQVLALNNLPSWKYYGYILIYIIFFMIDDLFVFFAAMLTLQAVGFENKYARYSRLIGGILIFILGLLLVFKPEILMFG